MSNSYNSFREIAANNLLFIQHFSRFLESNPYQGWLNLQVVAYDEHTLVCFDTDAKELINDQELLMSLPTHSYCGAAAETLWLLLEDAGHVNSGYGLEYAPKDLSTQQQAVWAARYRLDRGFEPKGRWAELEADEIFLLHKHLTVQSNAIAATIRNEDSLIQSSATSAVSSTSSCLRSPSQILNSAARTETSINNRIEAELEPHSNGRGRLCNHHLTERLNEVFGEYTFRDGLTVSAVTADFFRPIRFAGLRVSLNSTDSLAPLQAQVLFEDFRAVKAISAVASSTQWTEELCLALGIQDLYLSADYREWVLMHGLVDAENDQVYTVEAALLNKARTASQLESQLVGADDDDLPF